MKLGAGVSFLEWWAEGCLQRRWPPGARGSLEGHAWWQEQPEQRPRGRNRLALTAWQGSLRGRGGEGAARHGRGLRCLPRDQLRSSGFTGDKAAGPVGSQLRGIPRLDEEPALPGGGELAPLC